MKIDIFVQTCRQVLAVDVVKELQFCETRKWRFDYAIPALKIAIEVEGGAWIQGRHNRAQGFIADMDKYNTAAAMGWRLLRATPQTLLKSKFLDLLRKAINYEKNLVV